MVENQDCYCFIKQEKEPCRKLKTILDIIFTVFCIIAAIVNTCVMVMIGYKFYIKP